MVPHRLPHFQEQVKQHIRAETENRGATTDAFQGRLACATARREGVKAAEAKLRTAIQEKQTALQEKGALDRELKHLKGQAGRLTKDLEKKVQNPPPKEKNNNDNK
jgi:hypothetical protein